MLNNNCFPFHPFQIRNNKKYKFMKTIPAFLLLLSAILFTTNLQAQRWNQQKPNSIDFIFGLEYGHRLLSNSENDNADLDNLIRFRNNAERGNGNYRVGFNYNFLLTQKLFLKTGILYVNTGYKTKSPANYTGGEEIRLSESAINPYSGTYYRQIYQMLEFPLAIRYVYSDNWCKSYVEAGFSANHYLQTKLKGKDANDENINRVLNQETVRPWNFSTALAIGAEFLIQESLPAFIQMTARYQLSPLTELEVEERLVAVGIETGVRYEF